MSNLLKRITIDPNICHGKATIRGLRYTVKNILELMAAGMTQQEILDDYPDLEMDDLLACFQFASKLSQVKSIYKVAS